MSIQNITLIELYEQAIEVFIKFQYPENISKDITEPDVLRLKVKMGNIFINSEDFNRIEDDVILDLNMIQQMSVQDYEEAQSIAETTE